MAIEPKKEPSAQSARSIRWVTGTNVLVASALAVALVAVLQWGGYTFNAKADLTSTQINSLSEGTEKLLRSLGEEVRITSLYFQTDLEGPEQAKFRGASADLIQLYRMANPSKVVTDYVNPLQDHQKRKDLFARLAGIPKFKDQVKPYETALETFEKTLAPQIADVLSKEQETLSEMAGAWGEGREAEVLGSIRNFFSNQQQDLAAAQEGLQAARQAEVPDYTGVTSGLRTLYNAVQQIPKALDDFSAAQSAMLSKLRPDVAQYFKEAADRYRPLAEKVGSEAEKIASLPPFDLSRILQQYTPNGNCILVDTAKDARMITFSDTWPPAQSGAAPAKDDFSSREFNGEAKISSAILQLTQEEKPAVVFARFGGPPLFFGGFQPNSPPAPYMQMKDHLEDLNFTVHEWDLAESMTPPPIDPKPSRVSYVVLKPTPAPQQPMMGQQQPPAQFGEPHRKALLGALGDKGRAIFIAGWYPSQYGPVPNPYEYRDYLRDTWGIDVLDDTLVIQAMPVGPKEFRLTRGAENMTQTSTADQPIVKGLGARRSGFPLVAPLKLADKPPQGVEITKLIWSPANDGRWGVKDIFQRAQEQQASGEFPKAADDLIGPFTVAAAAARGESKIVVVSSPSFAMDSVAFANDWVLTPQGLAVVKANPSNVTLFVNALHWLADNTQWMNLGRPIESRVLEISEGPTLTAVRALVYVVWPALALACGGVVWIVRRR